MRVNGDMMIESEEDSPIQINGKYFAGFIRKKYTHIHTTKNFILFSSVKSIISFQMDIVLCNGCFDKCNTLFLDIV